MKSLEFTHFDEKGNPSLRYIALGESLSGQLLNFLEQFEDLTWHVLRNMGGKILGYIILGESLSGQLLGILEQFGELNGHMLNKRRGV